jgi:hypothetical protein
VCARGEAGRCFGGAAVRQWRGGGGGMEEGREGGRGGATEAGNI